MKEIVYKIDIPTNFSENEKKQFLNLLIKQDKVINPTLQKIERCHWLCICSVEDRTVSIGAIKPATKSDFDVSHANVANLSNKFKFELGYCYTEPEHSGNGHSTTIVKILLEKVGDVMASTELRNDNPMGYILKKYNFKQYGGSWISKIHSGALGLFLRYHKKT